MITIIKNIECYSPKYMGRKDIGIAGDKIYKVLDPGKLRLDCDLVRIIDGSGMIAVPGLMDGHVHIIGGGGEDGFTSRIGEISVKDILAAGITALVGLLGADHHTKSLYSLLAKAKALETEGVTTFIYTGSYAVPAVTFTGDAAYDLILIDKVIGAGEIAISDHRSSHPDIRDLLALSSKVHMGGLIGGKAGLLHFHLGDGKEGLSILNRLIKESDLPKELFLPTHVNRNPTLFDQAIEYVKSGGYIDLTSGEEKGISVPEAVKILIRSGIDMRKVTISSDANGSIPNGGIGKIQTLYDDAVSCITRERFSLEDVFPLVTENVAMRLKQHPKKGTLAEGSDADILIMNNNYRIEKLFTKGKLVMDDGNLI